MGFFGLTEYLKKMKLASEKAYQEGEKYSEVLAGVGIRKSSLIKKGVKETKKLDEDKEGMLEFIASEYQKLGFLEKRSFRIGLQDGLEKVHRRTKNTDYRQYILKYNEVLPHLNE